MIKRYFFLLEITPIKLYLYFSIIDIIYSWVKTIIGRSRRFNTFFWALVSQKKLLFLEMRVTKKIFTGAAANLLFNRFSGDILFSSVISFVFFGILVFFVCLFVFWNWKYTFWYKFDYGAGWVIKTFSPGRFPETWLLFFGLTNL